MTASRVNGSGNGARAGTRALALLASPLNATIVTQLADGPKRLVFLRRECGSPAQTTLRAHLKDLQRTGVIAKLRPKGFPNALEFELRPPGEELLFVVTALQHWLQQSPHGPVTFGNNEAKAAIKALTEGWSTTMLRALAAGPLSLTELDGVITALSYPSLERRLSAMRLTGQVEACPSDGKGTPYGVTDWLRRGIAPLVAAARWERRYIPDETAPITRTDTEAAFLLTLPLLRLPRELSGCCRMGVEVTNNGERRLAGAMARVDGGRIVSRTVRLDGEADGWATGSVTAWLQAVIEPDVDLLELGGDQGLARAVVEGLNEALFGGGQQEQSISSANFDLTAGNP